MDCLCFSADNTFSGSHERLWQVLIPIRRHAQRPISYNTFLSGILQAIHYSMSVHSSNADTCLSPSPSPRPRSFSQLLHALLKAAEELTERLDDNTYQALLDIDNKTKLPTRASLEFATHQNSPSPPIAASSIPTTLSLRPVANPDVHQEAFKHEYTYYPPPPPPSTAMTVAEGPTTNRYRKPAAKRNRNACQFCNSQRKKVRKTFLSSSCFSSSLKLSVCLTKCHPVRNNSNFTAIV